MPASFSSTAYDYNQLNASETVSRSGIMTSGAGVVKRGTIVGLASATGKYTKTDPASGIVAEDVDATAADAPCVVYVQGKFLASGVIWPAAGAHSVHTALLHDLGIYLLSAINETGLLVKPDTATVGFEEPPPTMATGVTAVPTTIDVGPGSAGGSIAVTSPSEDSWYPIASDPWITINPPHIAIVGNGSVGYAILANDSGSARSGSITIGDQIVAVTQGA